MSLLRVLVCVSLVGCSDDPCKVCDAGPIDSAIMDVKMDAQSACPSGKEPKDDPACVDESIGIFVSAKGNDTNSGTKVSPVRSLAEAFRKATSSKMVFVCEGDYTESADLKVPLSLYGGFKCTDWSYSGVRPRIKGATSGYTLRVDSVPSAIQIQDIELDAKDGEMDGDSSIALFVKSSKLAISRSTFQAGVPKSGKNGATTSFTFPDATMALRGKDASGTTGGAQNAFTMCPGGGTTTGGKGGDDGAIGQDGQPSLGAGKGGQMSACNMGGQGANGNAAMPKSAAVGANVLGALSVTMLGSFWAPQKGGDGAAGDVGQGGGGGVGAGGGGGGGGGAGGCGGAGGQGGGGGGASIAIVSATSTITIATSPIGAKDGAAGGAGSAGQAGQSQGGTGGNSTGAGCLGGSGGAGGAGGAGGGGAGGISAGILYKGMMPALDMDTKITIGNKGAKGAGAASNDGIDGVAQAVLMAP